MVSYLDDNIGKLIAALDETGLAAKTRVLYTSDHGESMGQKGMMSKCNMYDESVGVPVIMAGAGVPRGHAVDTPVQLLDVFPTILEATGTEPTDEDRALPGTSLFEIAGGAEPDRVILAEQHSGGAKSAVYMVRPQRPQVRAVHGGLPAPALRSRERPARDHGSGGGTPGHAGIVSGCEAALRKLLDPEAVDAKAKDDQAERIERGGGQEAIVAQGSLGYTPAPGEEPSYLP